MRGIKDLRFYSEITNQNRKLPKKNFYFMSLRNAYYLIKQKLQFSHYGINSKILNKKEIPETQAYVC